MAILSLGIFLIISLYVVITLPILKACGGYNIVFNEIENCKNSENNVIALDDVKASVDDDCILSISGCIIVSCGFTSAKVTVDFKKGFIKLHRIFDDLCSNEVITKFISCPIQQGRICLPDDFQLDISSIQRIIPLAKGKPRLNIQIDHGNGTSCIEGEVSIKKN